MGQVSRPLLAALVAAVAFLAIWMVALKPSSSSSSPSAPAHTSSIASGVLSAVGKAKGAVATSNAASAAHGGTVVTAPSASTPSASTPSATTPATTPGTSRLDPPSGSAAVSGAGVGAASQPRLQPAPRHSPTARRLDIVSRALKARNVLAMLFYNPRGPDDRAVKQELAAVPRDSGRVVELAVPLVELTRYPVVTSQVFVTSSPTLVIIDARHQATTIVGFADGFEIAQRITDALRVH